ncbi:MAG: 4Fe-4S binding protein, partial [Chitinispirillales bacterium]|nr:4Fe-4S binding protein [Chitinispirillales bacterium]
MRDLITNDVSICVGCNRCIRVCPVENANIAYSDGKEIRVKTDPTQCIVCGACIDACQHHSRDYYDDTDRFLADLAAGKPISMFVAPANYTNGENWSRLLTW